MGIKMGYKPAANERAKLAAAKQRVARNKFGNKVVSVILNALEPRFSRLEKQVQANIAEKRARDPSGIFDPLPQGIDRPAQSKGLKFKIAPTAKRAGTKKSMYVSTDGVIEDVPAWVGHRARFAQSLRLFAAHGESPIFFTLTPILNEGGDPVDENTDSRFINTRFGYGALSADFVSEDPKFLADDLARVQLELAEQNLKLELVSSLEIDGDGVVASVHDSSTKVAFVAAEGVPSFEAASPVVVPLTFGDMRTAICLRPGDSIHAEDATHWKAFRDSFRKLRRDFESWIQKDFPDFILDNAIFFKRITLGGKAPAPEWVAGARADFESEEVRRVATSFDTWRFLFEEAEFPLFRKGREVGLAELPFMLDEEQFAHLGCRLGASGLELQIRAAS